MSCKQSKSSTRERRKQCSELAPRLLDTHPDVAAACSPPPGKHYPPSLRSLAPSTPAASARERPHLVSSSASMHAGSHLPYAVRRTTPAPLPAPPLTWCRAATRWCCTAFMSKERGQQGWQRADARGTDWCGTGTGDKGTAFQRGDTATESKGCSSPGQQKGVASVRVAPERMRMPRTVAQRTQRRGRRGGRRHRGCCPHATADAQPVFCMPAAMPFIVMILRQSRSRGIE